MPKQRSETMWGTSVSHSLERENIKILTGTKDEVYLKSDRVMWNNGVLVVAQTDGSLAYLYFHISQAWVLASKAQGWETKSSHQATHTMCTYTLTQNTQAMI